MNSLCLLDDSKYEQPNRRMMDTGKQEIKLKWGEMSLVNSLLPKGFKVLKKEEKPIDCRHRVIREVIIISFSSVVVPKKKKDSQHKTSIFENSHGLNIA